MRARGPRADELTEPLDLTVIAQLQEHLNIAGDTFTVTVDPEALIGLLGPFDGRARRVLLLLLQGYSMGMAAASVGRSIQTLQTWARDDPEYAVAQRTARDWGFRRTAERELQRRAMAGPDDKASGRLLELWLKREDSAYREKSQVAMEITHKAGESLTRLVGGYVEPDPSQTHHTP
jgi:transposase